MGTVVAIGGGFGGEHADFLVRHILSLAKKKNPAFLLIPTAAFDSYGNGLLSRFFNWGCEVDVLCLSHPYVTPELVAEKIRKADIINVPGGNLRFLAEMWKKTEAGKYLKEAFDEGKVLFGDSSGAMCWFAEGYDDCGPENSFMMIDCLGLIPYANCPHYDSRSWQSFNNVAPSLERSSIALENDVALCLTDGKYSLLHSPERVDARAWFFDKDKEYRRFDLDAHPEILERL